MADSLIPERPLVVSPTLAASIGLEQALLLQHLQTLQSLTGQPSRDAEPHGYSWVSTSLQQLSEQLPFWPPAAVRRIVDDLIDLGLLLGTSATTHQQPLRLAINQRAPATTSGSNRADSVIGEQQLGAQRMHAHWQPSAAVLAQLAQQGVDAEFARGLVAEFILYWQDRGEAHHSWASKFLQHTTRRWQLEQDFRGAETRRQRSRADNPAAPMEKRWQPSLDAIEILERMGINRNFIDDAVAEFILYWEERGESQKTWNSKFVGHVKRQWARYTHTLKHDTEPRPIGADWQPDQEVYDVLTLANIDAEFARALIPEFILFWRDRNELHHSWNTKFLQHAKFHWARQNDQRSKDKADVFERLTDRSWAADLV